MDGFIIIDIVISLAFIYLSYSLLTSIAVEITDTVFNLRGRHLRKTIKRMLQDEAYDKNSKRARVNNFFRPKRTEKQIVKGFFKRPTIKFLGKSDWYPTPSFIETDTFSKTLIDMLSEGRGSSIMESIERSIGYTEGFDQKSVISDDKWKELTNGFDVAADKNSHLNNWLDGLKSEKIDAAPEFSTMELIDLEERLRKVTDANEKRQIIEDWKEELKKSNKWGRETRYQLCLMYRDAGGDLTKFKEQLDQWYDDTMVLSTASYKRYTARISFFFGFIIALSFNVDTLYISNELAVNEGLRAEFVANVESQNLDDSTLVAFSDSLGKVNTSIMHSFSLPYHMNYSHYDTTEVDCNDVTCCFTPEPSDMANQNDTISGTNKTEGNCCIKIERVYDGWLVLKAFFGWLLTALAISFGAPFWFDLLNKFIKFKGAMGSKPEEPNPNQEKKKKTRFFGRNVKG
jgi:hypothetical protein